jgi:protein subunit release factor B
VAYLKIAMEVRRSVVSEDNLPSMQQAGTIKQVELDEKDIEESFVRGGGAWGQKVNKTASKVVLLHIPTGVRVATQKTRSLEQNRKIARKLLREKVDEFLEGGEARSAVKAEVKRS